jgi:hypothetical protein
MSKSIHEGLPLAHRHRAILVYGRLFAHDAPGSASYQTTKQHALAEAEAYAIQYQANMAAQAGRPLTTKERISGKLERPNVKPGPQPCGNSVPTDPDKNPYDALVLSAQDRVCHTDSDRAQKAQRSQMYGKLQREWNERRQAVVAAEQHAIDPATIRLREHAAKTLDTLRSDPTSTPAAIWAAEDRLKASEGHITPGQYWTLVRDAGIPGEAAPPADELQAGQQ